MAKSASNKQKSSKALLRAGRNARNPGYKKHIRAHHKRTDITSSIWKRECLIKGVLKAMGFINEVPLAERLNGATVLQEERVQSMIFEMDSIAKRPVVVSTNPKVDKNAGVIQKAQEIVLEARRELNAEISAIPDTTRENKFRRCELRETLEWLDDAGEALIDAERFTKDIARKYHKARKGTGKAGVSMPEAIIVDSFEPKSVYDRLKNQKPVSVRGF